MSGDFEHYLYRKFVYFNHQVHRDFLITLYEPQYVCTSVDQLPFFLIFLLGFHFTLSYEPRVNVVVIFRNVNNFASER
jgi:hypothetical protein